MKWFLMSLLLMATASPALACSCAPTTREEIVANADAVFTGTASSITRTDMNVMAKFDVSDVEKGEVDEQIEVLTASDSAACGINFKKGKEMQLAVSHRNGTYHANLCQQMGLGRK